MVVFLDRGPVFGAVRSGEPARRELASEDDYANEDEYDDYEVEDDYDYEEVASEDD